MDFLKQFIRDNLLRVDGKVNNRLVSEKVLLKKFPDFYKEFIKRTDFIDPSEPVVARIYAVLNDIYEEPKCSCGATVKYSRCRRKFNSFCSAYCEKSSVQMAKLAEEASFRKYGTKAPSQASSVKAKVRKYFLKKLGVSNPFHSKEVQTKIKDTLIKKYGVDNPMKSPDVRLKFEANYKRKTGFINPSQNPEVQKLIRENSIKKYGCPHPKQNKYSKKLRNLLKSDKLKTYLSTQHEEKKKNLTTIAKELGTSPYVVSDYFKLYNLKVIYFYRSYEEVELYEFIQSIYKGPILTNDRACISPLELDLYLPELGLAIEFNGVYWHSYGRKETPKEVYKHRNKVKACMKKGIRLFTIFEDEWSNTIKKEIWKSILIRAILRTSVKVFGRTCYSKEVSVKISKPFYIENHLQGFTSATTHLGLFSIKDNKLLSIMSFKRNKDLYELVRFVTLKGHTVVGGASKLLDNFLKTIKNQRYKLVSFSDLRYSYGELYKTLGFVNTGEVPPRYMYVHKGKLFHRRSFQKKHLKVMLGKDFDSNKSETELVFSFTPYRRLWDCGKLKWELLGENNE